MRSFCLALALIACGSEADTAPVTDTTEPSTPAATADSTSLRPTSDTALPATGATGTTGTTGDTASPPPQLVVGAAIAVTEPGDQPEHHPAIGWGPTGWVAGWATFEENEGRNGLVSTSRYYSHDFAVAGAPLERVTGTTKPDIAAIETGWLIAWQHDNHNEIGFRRVDATGALLDPEPTWLDGQSPVHAGTVDLAVRPDGTAVLLWYRGDQQGSVEAPADGEYRVAAIDPQGASVDPPSGLWSTPPGGGSPPDVVPLSDGRVAAAIQRRHGAPDANGYYAEKVELHFLDPQLRPDGDAIEVFDGGFHGASRPSVAVDADDVLTVGWRTYDGPRSHALVARYDAQGTELSPPLELADAPAETDRPNVIRHSLGWLVAFEHSVDVGTITGVRIGLLDETLSTWLVEPIDVCAPNVRCSRPAFSGDGDQIALIHESGPDHDTHIEVHPITAF